MRGRPGSVRSLEELGRVRLSASFFMRDFLHSEIADFHGIPNIPDAPDLAIAAGGKLCEQLLEPLQATFGRLAIRSAYRAPAVNAFGNRHGLSCASNLRNYGRHIWDRRDAAGAMGAMATVVVPWFADHYRDGSDWRALAWWIHDHLPYSQLQFFPKLAAFNIGWHERPRRRIDSFIAPKGCLTRPGMANHDGSHAEFYPGFPGSDTVGSEAGFGFLPRRSLLSSLRWFQNEKIVSKPSPESVRHVASRRPRRSCQCRRTGTCRARKR